MLLNMEDAYVNPYLSTVCSPFDVSSFLSPAYGLPTTAAAQAWLEKLNEKTLLDGAKKFSNLIQGMGETRFLHRESLEHWTVDEVLNSTRVAPIGKRIWTCVRDVDMVKPEGMFNVALLVEGRRQYFSSARRSRQNPKWLDRLNNARLDCATAWMRTDGKELPPAMIARDEYRIWPTRSGCGAIYLRRAVYDKDGQIGGYTTVIVLVEFGTYDRRADIDDKIALTYHAVRVAHSHSADRIEEPDVSDMSPAWQHLVARARGIFEKSCKPFNAETDAWRHKFMAQRDLFYAERKKAYEKDSFFAAVKTVDWRAAMSMVREAWQLKAVIDTHCDSRFDESRHYCESNMRRVHRMISELSPCPSRREMLNAMISNFVEPMDELWSYCGD